MERNSASPSTNYLIGIGPSTGRIPDGDVVPQPPAPPAQPDHRLRRTVLAVFVIALAVMAAGIAGLWP